MAAFTPLPFAQCVTSQRAGGSASNCHHPTTSTWQCFDYFQYVKFLFKQASTLTILVKAVLEVLHWKDRPHNTNIYIYSCMQIIRVLFFTFTKALSEVRTQWTSWYCSTYIAMWYFSLKGTLNVIFVRITCLYIIRKHKLCSSSTNIWTGRTWGRKWAHGPAFRPKYTQFMPS